jgi:hypothetical protein
MFHISMRTLAAPLLALAFGAAAPLPLTAQIGNQSDHSGPVVTGGGMLGFLPVVTRPTRNAPLVDRNGRIHYGSTRVACAVSASADSLLGELGDARLQPTRSFAGTAIAAGAQRSLRDLVRSSAIHPADSSAFAAALLRPGGGESVNLPAAAAGRAAALAGALRGMMNGSESCESGKGTVPAEQLAHALGAYAAFVGAAPAELLRSPSGELLAVQAVLERLARAAVDAAR